ncbi:MAG: hypothetical protein E6J01_02855 [Chloroflexi bacterium]|nr:MAG: hypothetical protein E6J01_02855 [Chloroflexota bacterium]
MLSAMATSIYLESGSKRVFACALEWPGWCRSGKTEEEALAALATYASRYAVVAREARLQFPNGAGSSFEVMERIKGSFDTDFGVPGREAAPDRDPLSRQEAENLAGLLAASWTIFDRVVAAAPPALRKGPRGGGRDRDAIRDHVIGAESMYARKMGIRPPQTAVREAMLEAVRNATGTPLVPDKGWPVRYAVRRAAWHELDHAWEIEDRSR